MKHCLFFIAIIFASLFVCSTLFGFVWNVVGLITSNVSEETTAIQSYLFTGVGLVGWIVTSLVLVLVDELDGVDFDDELSLTE